MKNDRIPPQVCTPSTSLDPLETKSPPPPRAHIEHARFGNPEYDTAPCTPAESEFRHSGWAVLRHRTYAAMVRVQASEKKIDAFVNCGGGAWLYVAKSGDDLSIKCNKCHDRWCLACGRERAATITNNLLSVVSARTCRFVTLTLRHSRTSLTDQINRLYRSFAVLRRREFWKSSVTGGAAFLEIKVGKDGLWHPHLHVVCEGSWIDQKGLSREWLAVTGDSSIVDVRMVKDDGEAAGYLTKYLTKPASGSVYNNVEMLDEMMIALRGRRLCMTFGKWRGIVLEPKRVDDVEWQPISSLHTLRSKAAAGDVEAIRWVAAAARKWPLFASLFTPPEPPHPPDDCPF